MTYAYSFHGLTLSLPFPCPFLPRVETVSAPDVTVVYGPVARELEHAMATDDSWAAGYCWQAAPGRYLLKGGMKSGRFLVEGGTSITLQRNENAEDKRILFHLLHPVTAALFCQRGLLALHASTAHTPAGTIALCGRSQAGKSTTLAALLQKKGCAMVSDDITIVRCAAHDRVEVVAGSSVMHLWDDAAYGIGLDISGCDRHPVRRGKAALTAPSMPSSGATLLRKLCILEPGTGKIVGVSRVTGADKLDALLECVYGPLFQEEHPGLFPLFSATAEQADIFRIRRPESRWSLDDVVSVILDA
ncbi:hypothetical protein [Geotalea uraniireducens]|uniref:HPr kinase/phosphorylase C-terminal domain-containing protein n=1 Tax=Geotalea uraniireducens (strain Rf4) TaxID=351605 RepID=A5GA46_GEOUR|nr:hypothetical protein [Geotalea uraniireducens]ABQ25554.1 hypothetical protein Gura_1353 [Geotalea uraniireducens Rf4]